MDEDNARDRQKVDDGGKEEEAEVTWWMALQVVKCHGDADAPATPAAADPWQRQADAYASLNQRRPGERLKVISTGAFTARMAAVDLWQIRLFEHSLQSNTEGNRHGR